MQTHSGAAEVSRVNPSERGAAGRSMCLHRVILFTGINAFYTHASVGTLSRVLEPAGISSRQPLNVASGSFLLLANTARTFEERLNATLFHWKPTLGDISTCRKQADISNVVDTDGLQLIKTFLMQGCTDAQMSTQLLK